MLCDPKHTVGSEPSTTASIEMPPAQTITSGRLTRLVAPFPLQAANREENEGRIARDIEIATQQVRRQVLGGSLCCGL